MLVVFLILLHVFRNAFEDFVRTRTHSYSTHFIYYEGDEKVKDDQ